MNNLVASCLSENCSYNYSIDRTPSIHSVSPNKTSPGTLLNITGTGFGTNTSHVVVTIGNVKSNVSWVSETEIMFTVGKWTILSLSIMKKKPSKVSLFGDDLSRMYITYPDENACTLYQQAKLTCIRYFYVILNLKCNGKEQSTC